MISKLALRCTGSVRTIAVNVAEDSATLQSFAATQQLALPGLADRRAEVWRKLDGRGLPTNLLWSKTSVSLAPGPHKEAWWRRQLEAAGCAISQQDRFGVTRVLVCLPFPDTMRPDPAVENDR